jgi:minimal PKS acyl carrier protein
MRQFTLDELREILRQADGTSDAGGRSADIADVCYAELGYDSLARLDIIARIKQDLGIQVPDDAVDAHSVPAATVAAVNLQLASVS